MVLSDDIKTENIETIKDGAKKYDSEKYNGFGKVALRILEKRYYLRDKDGNLLEHTPRELFKRVADFIALAEKNYESGNYDYYKEEFFKIMIQRDFMPATPILFNAGTKFPMLSSCFALPIEDNLNSIMTTLTNSAKIFKLSGGVGWNFSKLRGEGAPLSTGGSSSGVCAFITLYDTMIGTIKEGAKRRGAGAAILDVSHPDIEKFINSKLNGGWTNLNISVICTDEFMEKVFNGDEKANKIFDLISLANHSCGDPNIIFIDTMNKYNPLSKYPIDSVNPCHEICMSSHYESCNLGGINLEQCLKGRKDNQKVDWDKLGRLIKMGHRFLDNMIDMCQYPMPEISEMANRTRRQGLYFFGLAPMLIKLGLRYGSQESLDFIDNLFCYINRVSLETCINLGKERGNFPDFDDSIYKGKYKYMRCSNRLTIAPSGTTSRISGSYFSIEPYYAFKYTSHIMDESFEEEFDIYNEYKDLYPDAMVTAHMLTPEEHLRVMATVGRWIDQSQSKTVNVPFEFTPNDIASTFKLAYRLGLKAVSIYRTGCKENQPLEEKNISIKKLKLDEKYIVNLYNKGYSAPQISEIVGISDSRIYLILKKNEVEIRPKGMHSRIMYRPDLDTIKFLHDKGLNHEEIARIYGREGRRFIDHLIEKTELSVGHHIDRSIPLSGLLIEFIEGELLGDGHISPVCEHSHVACYRHESKYREYLEWLSDIFSSEGLDCYKIGEYEHRDEKYSNIYYSLCTIGCVELMELRTRWYPNGVKIIPNDFVLTPIKMRQWFIGDGTKTVHDAIILYTRGFDEDSINKLIVELKKINLENPHRTKENDIFIPQKDSIELYKYMEQSVFSEAPCYDYKFLEKINEPRECRGGVCEL